MSAATLTTRAAGTGANGVAVTNTPGTFGAYGAWTVTRLRLPSSLLTAAQGWVAIRGRHGFASAAGAGQRMFWYAIDNIGTNRISGTYAAGGGTLQLNNNGGATQTITTPMAAFVAGDLYTAVFAWTATQLAVAYNGSVFTTAVRAQIPAGTMIFDVGSNSGGATWLDGGVLLFATGLGTLTNADAAAFNTAGANASPATFPAAARITGFMNAQVPWLAA